MDELKRKLNWFKSVQSKQRGRGRRRRRKGARRKKKQIGGKRRRKQLGGRRKSIKRLNGRGILPIR